MIEARVERNLAHLPDPSAYTSSQRTAARHLFSLLTHLEEIAVIAAERGDGVVGQLEDEHVHRKTFRRAALAFGGLEPASPEARALIDFLQGLHGKVSLALLNLVAENWLENVFEHLVRSGGFAARLFASVEEDEARHVEGAYTAERPRPGAITATLVRLEGLLFNIATSPHFMLPLIHLYGHDVVAAMGEEALDKHRRACAHLRIAPSAQMRRLATTVRALRRHRPPEEVSVNRWRAGTPLVWDKPEAMRTAKRVLMPYSSPTAIEAAVVRAVGAALERHETLRVVSRGGRHYLLGRAIVGVRRAHLAGEIITLFVADPHRKPLRAVQKAIGRKQARARAREYAGVPDLGSLVEILPPAECSVAVSYTGHMGVELGWGPLSQLEGIPVSIIVGYPHDEVVAVDGAPAVRRMCWIGIEMDHVVGDGAEIGLLTEAIADNLSRAA